MPFRRVRRLDFNTDIDWIVFMTGHAKPRAGGYGVHKNPRPMTSWLRGPILPMRREDQIFWQWREAQKPRPEWYGKGKRNG